MPFFSIIIPVYNVASYLRGCLNSVLSQAFTAWEAICVDDGSTDGSDVILDEYAVRDSRFHVIHQSNAGVSVARNMALDRARGEWIMMLDGDDQWMPNLLVRLCEVIRDNSDCDAIGFGTLKVNEMGERLGTFGCDVNSAVTTGDEVLLDGRGPKSHFIWACWDKAYRRSVIERNGIRFADGVRVGEDLLFVQKFFAQCGKVILAPEIVGYLYLMRDGSAMHTLIDRVPDSSFRTFFDLHDIWMRNHRPGVRRRLQLIAAEAPFLGTSEIFTRGARSAAIEVLLDSVDFRRIVIFLLRQGTMKMKFFALTYLLSPRLVRRKILEAL